MKVVVASDSFKGSLSSMGVATAAVRGVKTVCPDCEVVPVNIADGGEGLVEAVVEALGGEMVDVVVSDPLGRSISVCYGMAGKIAIIEMAAASGLPLLREEECNPWVTSTFGTGEMIMHAMRRGCRNFLVGLGGSATNDAGTGMLRAMGFRFYDVEGKEITDCCGGRLGDIRKVDVLEVADCVRQSTFVLACDVDIPFCGQDGAAYVFAPQKGADMDMVVQLDAGMASLAKVIEETCCVDIVSVAGAGAAGTTWHDLPTEAAPCPDGPGGLVAADHGYAAGGHHRRGWICVCLRVLSGVPQGFFHDPDVLSGKIPASVRK